MEQNMVLKLMRVREGAIIPKQATAGSAGYDLCACMDAPQTIEPGERCVFPSGLAAAKSRSACTISARSRTRCSRASALRK